MLLPLRRYWQTADDGRAHDCSGLILIPAGPGIVRRIGMFVDLPENKMGDVVEQEITIV